MGIYGVNGQDKVEAPSNSPPKGRILFKGGVKYYSIKRAPSSG